MTSTPHFPHWSTACFYFGIALAAPAAAQDVKPGLWEISTRVQQPDKASQDAMAKMQQQMASMPPAQRKQMEATMAGMGMAVDGNNAVHIKLCITPEEAAHPKAPMQNGNCDIAPPKRSGNTMTYSYQCTEPVAQGEIKVVYTSPTAYTVNNTRRAAQGGKTETTSVDSEGRWLQADCTGALNAPQKQKR